MKLDESLGHLDDIGLRRGIVQASDQRDYLRVYEQAVRQLAIPLTDIVMVLQSNAYGAANTLANTLAEAFPAATVHLLGMGAELTIAEQDSLLTNVRYAQCQRIASRRDYIRDRLPLRPQVIIEHGTNRSGQKRACFRTLFWSLPQAASTQSRLSSQRMTRPSKRTSPARMSSSCCWTPRVG